MKDWFPYVLICAGIALIVISLAALYTLLRSAC